MAETTLKRDFDLPQEDVERLDVLGLPWETVNDGGRFWLLIHNYPIPRGYNVATATAAIQIPPGYSTAPLDMVYFHPAISRSDGIGIGATQHTERIQGLPFQRWSRHRTQDNPWRDGVDDIAAHLRLVDEWLLREFRLKR